LLIKKDNKIVVFSNNPSGDHFLQDNILNPLKEKYNLEVIYHTELENTENQKETIAENQSVID
jgi:hypothetical protein